MRRSTAAAVGTLTGAALIIGVRLSVSAPGVVAAPPAVDLAGEGLDAPAANDPTSPPSKTGGKEDDAKEGDGKQKEDGAEQDAGNKDESSGAAGGSGLTDGIFKGTAVKNPYGTVQVSIKISGGKITAADATYPTTADSATINPPAVAALKQETLKAQSADVNAVSGATFTSESYVKSLQAAIDKAGA
ncbi:FMN-binding protein [Actinoplanes sp. TFC3]|uniref:FMN-binding protein n=1 Tax=Actinoplanes sp. TFC3 TaxID=1710355 RepID=UPI00083128BF|nr:FMN-binding protein [Actinoplanes sp. TFC3]